MPIRWSQASVEQLKAIKSYLGQSSPHYARALVQRIMDRVRTLTRFPEIGAVVPEFDDDMIREIVEHPYRIIYDASGTHVEILAVLHSARQLPPNVRN